MRRLLLLGLIGLCLVGGLALWSARRAESREVQPELRVESERPAVIGETVTAPMESVVETVDARRLAVTTSDTEAEPSSGSAPLGAEEASFELSVDVRREPEVDASTPLGASWRIETGERVLARGEGVVNGDSWGPVEVPRTPGARCIVRIEGEGVVPAEDVLRAPRAGEAVRVTLTARRGNAVWFLVVDEAEEPLLDARAELRWRGEHGMVVDVHTPRDDGYILADRCPTGVLEGCFSSPGHMTVCMDPLEVPEVVPGTTMIVLSDGGHIVGRCTSGGRPVRDFRVRSWPNESLLHQTEDVFLDREDGSFELRSVALGTINLVATSEGSGTSEIVRVRTEPGTTASVELALVSGARARGRVVDSSGAPVPDARVVRQVYAGGFIVGELGASVGTDDDGCFELDGLAPGETGVRVTAPGLSTAEVLPPSGVASEIELGVIVLGELRDLLVTLKPPAEEPAHGFSVRAVDGADRILLPSVAFDADGRARFEGVSTGAYGFTVALPGGGIHKTDVRLGESSEERVEIDLSGTAALAVAVTLPDGEELPWGSELRCRYWDGDAMVFRLEPLDERGRAFAEWLPAREMVLEIMLPTMEGGSIRGARRVRLTPGETLELTVALGEGDRTIRVVDGKGRPVSGASVYVYAADSGGNPFAIDLRTDDRGSCTVRGLGDQPAFADAAHPVHGTRLGVPFALADDGDVFVLVLEGEERVEVMLGNARGPVAGAKPRLCDARGWYCLDAGRTGADGRTSWSGLAEGEYLLRIEDEGYWPVRAPLSVPLAEGPFLVAMRELSALRIAVREGGLPRSSIALSLRYLDSDLDLAQFVGAESLVRSSTGTLTTDASGLLLLEGAPEGAYRWSVTTDDGPFQGEFTARPGENEVRIDLP